ncbi:hypothetical protein [Nocardioides sp. KR10-350]|uniref:hypothetical protein n=1 Tax=Nocardioides cheoyonin TaxID=3156615 RepID=UPI0032B5AB2C
MQRLSPPPDRTVRRRQWPPRWLRRLRRRVPLTRRGRWVAGGAAGGVVLLVVGLTVRTGGLGDGFFGLLSGDECAATAAGVRTTLDLGQAQRAGRIAAYANRRGLPARAVTVVLAVELTDHDLERRAARAVRLYGRLAGVTGYRRLPVATVAARVGGGSADSYADHEDDARALASALTGNSRAAFTCRVDDDREPAPDRLGPDGLVPRAERVRSDLHSAYGDLPLGGFAPGGVRTGHMEGSAHYEGRAIDVFFRPISPADKTRGWAVASYFVSQADRLDIATVIFDDRIWTSERSDEGWRDYDPPERSGDRRILEHRDHVHVDVAD